MFVGLVIAVLRFDSYAVRYGSMEPTLFEGDILIVDSWARRGPFGIGRLGPAKGEVWVFTARDQADGLQVKRFIGLPGDTIAMRQGVVCLNDARLKEPYARHGSPAKVRFSDFAWQLDHLSSDIERATYEPSPTRWGPLVVPDSSHFVLGDHRMSSIDSRYQGFVGSDQLRGRVIGIAFSYGAMKPGTLGSPRGVRWNRLGRLRSP